MAEGNYVAFQDDDDLLLPDYVVSMVAFFEDHGHEIDFAWPTLRVVDLAWAKTEEAQKHSCLVRRHQPASEADYAATAYTRTNGMMFRSKFIREADGFDCN